MFAKSYTYIVCVCVNIAFLFRVRIFQSISIVLRRTISPHLLSINIEYIHISALEKVGV